VGGARHDRKKPEAPQTPPSFFLRPPCSTDYSTILRALAGQRLERFAARPRGSMGEGVTSLSRSLQFIGPCSTELDTSLSRSPHRLWPDTRRAPSRLKNHVQFNWTLSH